MLVVHGISPALRAARMVSSKIALRFYPRSPITDLYAPAVVWTNSNPTPWNSVKQDENVKMMAVNQKFEKRYASQLVAIGTSFNSTSGHSWSRDKL